MLLVGALLGIFGQQAARAAGPMWHPIAAPPLVGDESTVGNADCTKMVDKQHREKPCKGLTLDCIAAMGCVVPMTLSGDLPPAENVAIRHDLPTEAAILGLAGRMLAPEPEPPAILI